MKCLFCLQSYTLWRGPHKDARDLIGFFQSRYPRTCMVLDNNTKLGFLVACRNPIIRDDEGDLRSEHPKVAAVPIWCPCLAARPLIYVPCSAAAHEYALLKHLNQLGMIL